MESNDEVWASLATRAIRVLLVRKEFSYARLAEELASLGVEESARSVEGKVQRGAFRFSFFLQALVAMGADYPAHWGLALRADGTWDDRASMLLQQELLARPWLSWPEVSRRLSTIGESIQPRALARQVRTGAYAATLFLQCAVVCSFEGLELFVDRSDLRDAAERGVSVVGRSARRST